MKKGWCYLLQYLALHAFSKSHRIWLNHKKIWMVRLFVESWGEIKTKERLCVCVRACVLLTQTETENSYVCLYWLWILNKKELFGIVTADYSGWYTADAPYSSAKTPWTPGITRSWLQTSAERSSVTALRTQWRNHRQRESRQQATGTRLPAERRPQQN